MAVNKTAVQYVYGLGDALIQVAPLPILANRAPSNADLAQLGTLWVDVPDLSVYTLAGITANEAHWVTSAASGVGIFTSLEVDPGDATITAGDLIVSAGNIDVTVGDVTIGGDLTVAGTTTLEGTIDIDSAAAIDVNSSYNGAGAVTISTDGGTASTLVLYNSAGTGDDSIQLLSDLGAVELTSSRATDGSINLNALLGGVYINAATQLRMESTEGDTDSVLLQSVGGGMELNADTGIAVTSNGLMTADVQTASVSSPTAAATLNVNIGAATFAGFTTASTSAQEFTITNSLVTTASSIIATACNEGTQDAQMTVTRIKRAAGSFVVTLLNNGTQALNGNVTISFWVMD